MSAAAMIPLSYRPPQFQNPAQVGAQWQDLRNAAVQGQAAQLQLNEMQQRQKEQQLLSQSYLDAHGDMNKFFQTAAAAGVRPQTILPVQQQWNQVIRSQAEADLTKTAATHARNNEFNGALMGAFSTPDSANPMKRTWRDPTPQEAGDFLEKQFKAGNLTQADYDNIKQNHPNNTFSAVDLQAISSSLHTADQARQLALDTQTQTRLKAESDARIAAEGARATEEQSLGRVHNLQAGQLERSDWASRLQLATTPEAYKAIVDSMPNKDLKAGLPDPSQFDPKTTPDLIRRWGLSPDQRTRELEAEARLEESKTYHNMMGNAALLRGDAAQTRADNTSSKPLTATQRNAAVQQLATTAYNNLAQSDAFKGRKPSYHDVITSVLDQNNYVGETNAPDMAANRLAVAQYLGELEKKGLDVTKLTQQIDKGSTGKKTALERMQDLKTAQSGQSPTPASRPQAAPQSAAPPQPSAPSQPPPAPEQRPSPMPAAAPGTPKTYTVGQKTYTEGQVFQTRDGKWWVFSGIGANGKIQGEPR